MKKPDFKKALNEMLSKPTSGKTQAAMDRLFDNVLTGEKSSQKVLFILSRLTTKQINPLIVSRNSDCQWVNCSQNETQKPFWEH